MVNGKIDDSRPISKGPTDISRPAVVLLSAIVVFVVAAPHGVASVQN
ncbi:hypothetical protein A2U01_0075433, partial [Trifolium medium]|nr:hypothetical protein [Trifolium medium]